MKKICLLIFAIALFISVLTIMIQKENDFSSGADAIYKAFYETGAAAVSSEIYVRGVSERKVMDEGTASILLEEIVRGIGAVYSKEVPVFNTIENDYTQGVEINYIIDGNKTILLSVSGSKEDRDNSNVVISFFDTSTAPSVKKNVAAIVACLDKRGIDYKTNISLTGSIAGKLEEDAIEDLYIRAFESIGANKVEGIHDNGLVSVSAFSPSISETVNVNGKSINMNMAVRYNSYEGKTYIWLATPVITTVY